MGSFFVLIEISVFTDEVLLKSCFHKVASVLFIRRLCRQMTWIYDALYYLLKRALPLLEGCKTIFKPLL